MSCKGLNVEPNSIITHVNDKLLISAYGKFLKLYDDIHDSRPAEWRPRPR